LTTDIKCPEEGDEVHYDDEIWFVASINSYDHDSGWDVDLDNTDDDAEESAAYGIGIAWNKKTEKWEG